MSAWYDSSSVQFIQSSTDVVVGQLAKTAASEGWDTPPAQEHEWNASIDLLKHSLSKKQNERVEVLQTALTDPRLHEFEDVILEYDFRRRGLRMDCVLLAPGIIVILEFKRQTPTLADRDQAMSYAINLREFHEVTQKAIDEGNLIIAPIVVSTQSTSPSTTEIAFHESPWNAVIKKSLVSDAKALADTLAKVLAIRRGRQRLDRKTWISSRFKPSSSILDAAISLYGQHDVSAINQHAVPAQIIAECVEELQQIVTEVREKKEKRVIFISGAPGAGKTLVGLQLLFKTTESIFVTGNAPLVDVLQLALKNSYRERNAANQLKIPSGYKKQQLKTIIDLATFPIEKAHRFLKSRSSTSTPCSETLVIFDEAQRTYLEGRTVADEKLKKDEAHLVLESLEKDHPGEGLVVICLLGHNQAINTGESGIISWFKAVDKANEWSYQISEDTLNIADLFEHDTTKKQWTTHPKRKTLKIGHLDHSLRFYKNRDFEKWASAVVSADLKEAKIVANRLEHAEIKMLLTRNLNSAKKWIQEHRVGEERAGMIASSQARRLIAEGIHVLPQADSKIGHWMLAPSGDIRSSNTLEVAQNQFQIQGLELDYTLLCWDADFRRTETGWDVFKISGAKWQRQKSDEEKAYRENSYRVLLTRARKGMVIYVPHGDTSDNDETRKPEFYDAIFEFLKSCGCQTID
ncbi:MAG: DNA/RNA helicase domain-containing protein [Opitutaceae bacterium]